MAFQMLIFPNSQAGQRTLASAFAIKVLWKYNNVSGCILNVIQTGAKDGVQYSSYTVTHHLYLCFVPQTSIKDESTITE